jgi:hypothetical protein
MSPTDLPNWSAMMISTSDGGNDLRQRSGSGNDAGGEFGVVAVAQHDRQRDQTHRDHRGGDDAGRRGEQRADEDHRKGQAATQRPEKLADGIEQILGHARSFEDQPHEGEERDGQQRVVVHDAEDAVRQAPGTVVVRAARVRCRSEPKKMPLAASAKDTGKPTSRKEDHRNEDDRRHVGDQELGHHSSPFWALMASASSSSGVGLCALAVGSGHLPCRKPTRLINSEMP